MLKQQFKSRPRIRGTTIAEMPLGLWIVFVGLTFPLFILVLTTVRFALFWEAAREAAQYACQSETYLNNPTTGTGLSAVNTAVARANFVTSSFPGISIGSINLWIIVTPANSSAGGPSYVGPNTPLTAGSVDTSQNMYQVRVVLNGHVQPIIAMQGAWLGSIPGLTAPFEATVKADRVFENPEGLIY